MSEKRRFLLNLGCGDTAPKRWENYDSSWNAQLQKVPILRWVLSRRGQGAWPRNVRYMSLRRIFPWKDASVDCVYASHVIEHLDDTVVENFMREAYRVLKPGSALRIVVPDLLYHARKYVASWTAECSAAEEFLYVLHLQLPTGRGVLLTLYDVVTGHPHLHKNMYDANTLRALVENYGFQDLRFLEYGESEYIEEIRDVEFRNGGYEGSLYLEALKPQ